MRTGYKENGSMNNVYKNKIKQKLSAQGFSLIELLVVLVIMGMLAGLVGPRLFGNVDKAKVKTANTQIKMLKGSLQTYRLDVGAYPTTDQGLSALTSKPATAQFWQGPYLDDALPLDPWGKAYQYEKNTSAEQGFYLYSLGADGKRGGDEFNADVGYTPR